MALNGLDLQGRVVINTVGATNSIKRLAAAFTELDLASKKGLGVSDKTARAFAEAATAASNEKTAVANLARAQQGLNKQLAQTAVLQERANAARRQSLASAGATRAVGKARAGAITSGASDATAVAQGKAALSTQRALTEEIRRTILAEDAQGRAAVRAAQVQSIATRDQIAQQRLLLAQTRATQSANGALGLTGAANALGTVGGTIARVSSSLLLATGIITAFGVAGERSFAQVIRTSGATGNQVALLKQQFDNLADALPVSYNELTKIGAVAGQLGIAESQIGSFTATVAKFSATSNVSLESAATAFGRLDTLLPDVKGNYESLADSILNVGVKSVATESQIINILTQLSATANQAGLTSKELVGLSGALASVGAQPELSRGTFTRFFTLVQDASSKGGEALQNFAAISGESTDAFKKEWSAKDTGPAFIKFMDGLADKGREGNQALLSLGINSVRDRPLLLRLASATQVVGKNADGTAKRVSLLNRLFAEAAEKNAIGTLSKQYSILNNTTSAKLQVLLNNIQTFFRTISQANLGPLNGIISGLTDNFSNLNATLNDNVKLFGSIELPFKNSELAGTIVLIGGIVAVIGLLAGGLLKLSSTFLRVGSLVGSARLGYAQLTATVTAATLALRANAEALVLSSKAAKINQLNGTFVASTTGVIGRASDKSTKSVQGLRGAFSSLGGSIVSTLKFMGAFALITAAVELPQFVADLQQSSTNVDVLSAKLERATVSGQGFSKAILSVQRSDLGGLIPNPGAVFKNIDDLKKALDDGPRETNVLTNFLSVLGAGANAANNHGTTAAVNDTVSSLQKVNAEFPKLNDSLKQVGQSKGFETVAKGLGQFKDEAKLTNKEMLTLLKSTPDVLNGIKTALASSGKDSSDKGVINYINSLNKIPPATKAAAASAAGLKAALTGTAVSAEDFSSSITGAYNSAIDFNKIYQSTLDQVNSKAKQKWVAAGNDVSTFTETASAHFTDFAKTAEAAITKAQKQQANIATVAQAFGDGGAAYVPQLETLAPGIVQDLVNSIDKGGTEGVTRLKKIFDQANLGPKIGQQLADAIDEPRIASAYTAFGGKLGKQFSQSLATSFSDGSGAQGAIDKQFEQTYQSLQDHKPVKLGAELDTAPAQKDYSNYQTYLEAQVLYAQVHGNTDEAQARYKELQDYIANHPATTTIDADAAPMRRTGEDAYTYLSELIPVMQIQGYDIPVRKKGEDAEAYINRLIGIMTVNGDNKKAKEAADAAKRKADGTTGTVKIDADTSAADLAIYNLTRAKTVPVFFKAQNSIPSPLKAAGAAVGGIIRGPGTGTSDSIPAMLSNGEFVVRAAQAKKNMALLTELNGGAFVHRAGYANGGPVNSSANYEGTYASRQSVQQSRGSAINVTELSAYDRHLLEGIRDRVGVTIEAGTVSQATSTGNTRQSRRGNG